MAEPRIGTRIEVGGRTVHYHEVGDGGPPVVLLHGCGSLGEEILPAFAAAAPGLRILSLDRPGYGFSEPLPAGEEGADGQADWLAAVLGALDLGPVVLAAHSLGSGPALCFAARHPETLLGVVLLSPFCRPTPHAAMPVLRAAVAPVVGPFIREVVVPIAAPILGPGMLERAIRPNPVPDYLADFPFAHAGHPGAILAMAAELFAFNRAMEDAEDAIRDSHVPVVVLHGAADTIAEPDWHLPWLSGLMPGAEVSLIGDVGHAPHHARPDLVVEAVRRLAEPA